MRKYKPVVLPLKQVPDQFSAAEAACPNCNERHTAVIGRLGLRLVFRCESCRVRFHRHSMTSLI